MNYALKDDDNNKYYIFRFRQGDLYHFEVYAMNDDTLIDNDERLTLREVKAKDGGEDFVKWLSNLNRCYYVETNGYNGLVVVAHDDEETAALWEVKDLAEADNMDCSEVIDYTAEQMKNAFDTFTFNPDDFEKVVKL